MTERFPLTFQQQWLWDLLRQNPGWQCVLGYAYRVSGVLETAKLRGSIEAVIGRHGALRTRVGSAGGELWQEMDALGAFELSIVDVRGADGATAQRLAMEFTDQPIDPAVGPPVQFCLFRLRSNEHILALRVHRVMADCFAVDQMLEEVWVQYAQSTKGLRLQEPAPQYSEYAIRQRASHPEWRSKHAAYWQERLQDAPLLRWPGIEYPLRTEPTAIAKTHFSFGTVLSAGLHDMAKRSRTLTANAMLAVYVAALARWCNQRDLVLPFNVAGRQSAHRHIVGYFSHVLYLRLKLTGSETYRDLLRLVSDEFFRSLMHQDFGLMATRNPGHLTGTFFQWISWNHDEVPVSVPQNEAGLRIERVPMREFSEGITAIPPGFAAMELTVFDTPRGIECHGMYRNDLFTPSIMTRFMDDLCLGAEDFIRDPLSDPFAHPVKAVSICRI
jgi:Condensation domain